MQLRRKEKGTQDKAVLVAHPFKQVRKLGPRMVGYKGGLPSGASGAMTPLSLCSFCSA